MISGPTRLFTHFKRLSNKNYTMHCNSDGTTGLHENFCFESVSQRVTGSRQSSLIHEKKFKYKIGHVSKTKNRKNLKIGSALVLEHYAFSWYKFFLDIFGLFFVKILSILRHIS